MKTKKFVFRFKAPAVCINELVMGDAVIADTLEKAYDILEQEYDLRGKDTELIRTEDIVIYEKDAPNNYNSLDLDYEF